MNVGTFSGYVGRDSEAKSLPSGQKVLNFSVGVTIGFGDKKETLWVSCAMWGERGEKLAQYIVKGVPVTVSGDVTVRAYSAKDGAPKAELICNVQRITLQGKSGGKSDDRPAAPATAPAPAAYDAEVDSIPF